MPWLEIAAGLSATVVVGFSLLAMRSRRQRQERLRRSEKRRRHDADIARDWEDLQLRARAKGDS